TVHNCAFNVGQTKENYRIAELAEIVKETVPGCQVEYSQDAGPDKRCYRVDFSRIQKTLPSFKPQWDARRGAEQLYRSYRQVNLRVEDFEGARYNRIDHLQSLLSSGQVGSDLRWRAVVPVFSEGH